MEQREKGRISGWVLSACTVCNGTNKVLKNSGQDGVQFVAWFPGDAGDPIDCPYCEETLGDVEGGHRLRLRNQRDVFPTWEIFECIDATEYTALNGSQTKQLEFLLSLGEVNIGESTKVRQILSALFSEGSITRTNIENLIANQAKPLT